MFIKSIYCTYLNKLLLLIFIAVIFCYPVIAQEIEVQSPESVQVGETFFVRYKIEKRASAIEFTDKINHFFVQEGPSQSASHTISIIKGVTTNKQTTIFTYKLTALQEGEFNLPIVSITVEGTKFISAPVTIKVGASKKESSINTVSRSDVFLKLNLSKSTTSKLEPIFADLIIYSNLPLVTLEKLEMPEFDDFLKYNMDSPAKLESKTDTIDGRAYNFVKISSFQLIPIKAGEKHIEPVKVKCEVRLPNKQKASSIFDEFFQTGTQTTIELLSDSVTISVTDFPLPQPSDFKWITGSEIQITSAVTSSEVLRGNPFSLELRIAGNNNLRLLQAPELKLPDGIKVLSVNSFNQSDSYHQATNRSRTFRYSLLPTSAGKFEIPSVSMSYYNPVQKSYEHIESAFILIDVKETTEDSTFQNNSTLTKNTLQHKVFKSASLFLIDLSGSMMASDFLPNRKVAIVNQLTSFIDKTKHPVGVMMYAAFPQLLNHVSNNKEAVKDSLKQLNNYNLGDGTATGIGILQSVKEVMASGAALKNIVLITDGDSNSGSVSDKLAAELTQLNNVRLFIVGMSTNSTTAPITIQTEYGEHNTTIPITINDRKLKTLAEITGGVYFRVVNEQELSQSLNQIDKLMKKQISTLKSERSSLTAAEVAGILSLVTQDIEELKNAQNENKK